MTSQIQYSAKAHDGTILVIGGDNVDEFKVNLTAFLGDVDTAKAKFDELQRIVAPSKAAYLPDVIQQAENVVRGAFPDAAPAAPAQPPVPAELTPAWTPAPAQTYQRPARPAGPPPGQSQPPVCEHGYAREFKSGTSKAGKPYKMWACPLRRDEGACEPQWIR